MLALLALLIACSPAHEADSGDDSTDSDTAATTADTDTDTGATTPAPADLAHRLYGPVMGYFLEYSAELDEYPDQDGWIYRPTLWTWGAGTLGAGPVTAYIWSDDPSSGGYQLDSYAGTFEVEGSTLRLTIDAQASNPAFGIACIPSLDDDGTVSFEWTRRNGVAGVISMNDGWNDYPATGADTGGGQ